MNMSKSPYISVVAVSRNDDHGGDMLRRQQIFVNALAQQCERFHVPAELVLVDWNPPADRPPLFEAIEWPKDPDYFAWRVIQVPPELHKRFDGSDTLPLFQMIGKNVGIRRAAGEYILATNVDVLIDDRTMERLARRQLRPREMYRVDRYDTEAHLNAADDVRTMLDMCRGDVMRVSGRGYFLWPKQKPSEPQDVSTGRFPIAARILRAAALPYRALRHPARYRQQIVDLLLRNFGDRLGVPIVSTLAQRRRMMLAHTNACGDFTLISREDWFSLEGYIEFEGYSYYVDSVLCHSAIAEGVREVYWADPLYHMEHRGGYKPEGRGVDDLRDQSAARGIAMISEAQIHEWRAQMRLQLRRLSYNGEDWGLAHENLREWRGGASAG